MTLVRDLALCAACAAATAAAMTFNWTAPGGVFAARVAAMLGCNPAYATDADYSACVTGAR